MIVNKNVTDRELEEKESIENIIQQQAGSFRVVGESSSERVFHWIDREVCMLSSRKLWDIIRLSGIEGCELDREFVEEVVEELKVRNEYSTGNPWNPPH